MAKIPLRAYVKEIENLIERGEIEQAAAHAKNILQTYPKHIETYRVMGKAFIESQRYSQALDILQRILSVIPDDFMSQIGMSIIREDEGNLDQAIWHMERAYEVQPFNPAVQDELRRLYGRRDGAQPHKIRLTRGALVRLYARGELYPQAIAETRMVLAEEPSRLDMEVLLARLYHFSKQKIEAINQCFQVLTKLPYSRDALEILTEILPGTNRENDVPAIRQRLFSMDPYAAFVSSNDTTSERVPEQAVQVERFIWDTSMPQAQGPEWAQTVGVQWEETAEEALPDWLNTLKPSSQDVVTGSLRLPTMPEVPAETQLPPVDAGPEEAEPEETGLPSDAFIPDFLKDAGWTKSDRKADEIMAEQLDEPESATGEGEIAPAEIPDWLQSIAPQEEGASAQAEESGTSDWFNDLMAQPSQEKGSNGKNAPVAFIAGGEEPAGESVEPDWLTGLEAATLGMGTESPDNQAPENDWMKTTRLELPDDTSDMEIPAQSGEENLADWLSTLDTPGAESTSSSTGESSDWLQGLGLTSEVPAQTGNEMPASEGVPGEEAPDWLDSFGGEGAGAQSTEGTTPAGEVPDWMQSLVSGDEEQTGAFPATEELPAEEELPAAEIPDWMQSLMPKETAVEAEMFPPEPTAAEPSEETPDWLQALATGEPSEAVEPATAEDQTYGVVSQEAELLEAGELEVSAVDELPEAGELPAAVEQPAAQVSGMPDMNDIDATMAWLEALAARQGADEATLITPPEQRTEEMPDWIRKQTGELAPVEAPQTEELPEIEEPVAVVEPSGVEQPVISEELPAIDAELPEWLKDAGLPEMAGLDDIKAVEEAPAEQRVSEEELLPAVDEQPAAALGTPGMPDMNDMDATMAWLEALAARQGADEATLITPPEQRTDQMPDWVLKQTDKLHPEAVEQGTPPVEGIPQEETPGAGEAVEAELPEWLKQVQTPGDTAMEQPAVEDQEMVEQLSQVEELSIGEEGVVAEETASAIDLPEAAVDLPAFEQPAVETATGMPDLSDMDATMAWLEALAAKQGADEATLLITPPEQRSEETPDWLRKQTGEVQPTVEETAVQPAAVELPEALELPAAEAQPHETAPEAPEMPAEEQVPAWLAGVAETGVKEVQELETPSAPLPLEQPPIAETPALSDMDAAMAWLEGLAARQGADEGTLFTPVEQRTVEMPEWVKKQTGELKMPGEEPAADKQPAAEEQPVDEFLAREELPTFAEETVPTDLAAIVESDSDGDTETLEMPEWLRAVEPEAAAQSEPTAETAWETPAGEETEGISPISTPSVSTTDWLEELEEASIAEAARAAEKVQIPVEGVRSAWTPEVEIPLPEPEPKKTTGSLNAPPGSLEELRYFLRRGDLDNAIQGYTGLIQKGETLADVIHDLRDALYRYPVDISIWQALGDAYAHNNQLQDALDAYTKAEELLR